MNQVKEKYFKGDSSTHLPVMIEIQDLTIGFGEEYILNHISLKLFEGENLVVLGKSGIGKSVLIKCIVGLLYPDHGNIIVLGHNISKMKPRELDEIRKKIGFLFQGGALYDSMSVRQNLEFPLRRIKKNLSAVDIDLKIMEALENVGLADAIDKMPGELSGGMRKRVSLARTIAAEPLIMLYDEPTTGLDPVTSDEISTLIRQIQQKYKTSSIIITHDIECARNTADRVIMLHNCEVYYEGKLAIFEKSTDPIIKSFFK